MKMKIEDDWGAWSENNRTNFRLLASTKNFKKLIQKARKGIGLDEKKLPLNFETGKLYSATESYADDLIELYDLSTSWAEPLKFFIVTGKMRTPGAGISMSGFTLEFKSTGLSKHPSAFSITVTEKMGYTSIVRFINQHKGYIQNYLNQLPRRRSKIHSPELKLAVYKLHEKSIHPSEIAQIIVDKYDYSLDEQTIWNWLRRMNKALAGKKIK